MSRHAKTKMGMAGGAQNQRQLPDIPDKSELTYAHFGRVGASLLHEISNPIAAALLYLEQIEPTQSCYKNIQSTIQQMQVYVEAARQQLLGECQPTWFSSSRELRQVKRIIQPIARSNQVHLRFSTPVNVRLYGEPVKFQQICANLLLNAIEAYDDCWSEDAPNQVTCSLESDGNWLVIRITDNGPGIDSAVLPHLYTPFQTTKNEAENRSLGLGLATVKRYIEENFDGSIDVRSTPLIGTSFVVKLRLTPRYKRML